MTDINLIRDYIKRINQVVDYVEANIDKDIKLQDLAEIACFSQYHFHRIFNMLMKETPKDFLRRIRVERAALMLKSTEQSMGDIAFYCGFSSQATFSRAFKDRFRVSPSEWKKGERQRLLSISNSKECKTESKNEQTLKNSKLYFEYVNKFLSNYRIGKTEMKVSIQNFDEMQVAYVANHEGYNEEKIGIAWEKVCAWAGPKGLLNQATNYIGIGFDDPKVTSPDKCRYYACVTVPKGTEVSGEVGLYKISAGRYAIYRVEVYGNEIEGSYIEFGAWLTANGYEPADSPSLEIYHTTACDHPEGKFDMSICIQVK